jgi:hypothetical protein
MTDLLTRALGFAVMIGVPLALLWLGSRCPAPTPAKRPQAPPEPLDSGEWLLLPFQLAGGLAGLLWCLIGVAAFLSPLLVLAWLVAR